MSVFLLRQVEKRAAQMLAEVETLPVPPELRERWRVNLETQAAELAALREAAALEMIPLPWEEVGA